MISLQELLEQHLKWYPLMELSDVYKLLYQGIMGSEHLVSSPVEFSQHLELEIAALIPDTFERLVEPVRPDLSLLRINLRPYKMRYPDTDLLIELLVETTLVQFDTIEDLHSAWVDFTKYCERGVITRFELDQVHQFTTWLSVSDFPTVHHSAAYHREYKPAYRLIASKFLPRLKLNYAI
jgi:hypothetical protein